MIFVENWSVRLHRRYLGIGHRSLWTQNIGCSTGSCNQISFCSDVVFYSVNMAFRGEDNIFNRNYPDFKNGEFKFEDDLKICLSKVITVLYKIFIRDLMYIVQSFKKICSVSKKTCFREPQL